MGKPLIPETCTVALLAGGTSAEREISLASGEGAEAALREAGFPVRRFDPASAEDMAALAAAAAAAEVQVAFLCLHGKGGEDGTIQATLEGMGLPYTGSGVEASKIAIDKNCAKCAYKRDGLPTAPWVYVERDLVERAREHGVLGQVLGKTTELLGEHVVVKAIEQGSTQGLFIVESAADLEKYVDKALEFDDAVVIEQFIAGDEFTVAVLGNALPVALPVIQIVPKSGFYDFEAKYAPGGSKHLCPAPISDELTARMKNLAVAAHLAIGCRGVSRTDFIVDADGKPWILETNTIPGMTKTSLLPDAARVAGMDFPALCTRLVQLALE
ncbi:MAG: D-alanine--D-alanine ligase [Eggerthellaceae bacterium]|nr:D-alanine--D-alanine ligase [Eggerthellaceae bacterium]